MSLKLYADVHVRRAISVALRVRGVDVLTAQADGAAELEDPELLDRATTLARALFTQDEDLLAEGLHHPDVVVILGDFLDFSCAATLR